MDESPRWAQTVTFIVRFWSPPMSISPSTSRIGTSARLVTARNGTSRWVEFVHLDESLRAGFGSRQVGRSTRVLTGQREDPESSKCHSIAHLQIQIEHLGHLIPSVHWLGIRVQPGCDDYTGVITHSPTSGPLRRWTGKRGRAPPTRIRRPVAS